LRVEEPKIDLLTRWTYLGLAAFIAVLWLATAAQVASAVAGALSVTPEGNRR